MSETTTTSYAVYSAIQFDNICNVIKTVPYIYYRTENEDIVQVTEVFEKSENKSLYMDAIYLGKVTWFGAFHEAQNVNENNGIES